MAAAVSRDIIQQRGTEDFFDRSSEIVDVFERSRESRRPCGRSTGSSHRSRAACNAAGCRWLAAARNAVFEMLASSRALASASSEFRRVSSSVGRSRTPFSRGQLSFQRFGGLEGGVTSEQVMTVRRRACGLRTYTMYDREDVPIRRLPSVV